MLGWTAAMGQSASPAPLSQAHVLLTSRGICMQNMHLIKCRCSQCYRELGGVIDGFIHKKMQCYTELH